MNKKGTWGTVFTSLQMSRALAQWEHSRVSGTDGHIPGSDWWEAGESRSSIQYPAEAVRPVWLKGTKTRGNEAVLPRDSYRAIDQIHSLTHVRSTLGSLKKYCRGRWGRVSQGYCWGNSHPNQ